MPSALTGLRCRNKAHPARLTVLTVLTGTVLILLTGCISNPTGPGTTALSSSPATTMDTAHTASTAFRTASGSPAATSRQASSLPASTPPDTGTSQTSEPAAQPGDFVPFRTAVADSAAGKRIGLIGLDQTNPFSKLVSESIKRQAVIAGADLIYCDAEGSAELALRCARRLATQKVDGWINFQPVVSAGEAICVAGPKDVPMIAVDSNQGDCQSTRIGTDDRTAGFSAGQQLGRFVQGRFGCRYDAVLYLLNPGRGVADQLRRSGAEKGLASVCAPDAARLPPLTVTATTQDSSFAAVSKALTGIKRDQRVLVVGSNDGLTQGAIGAARSLDRLNTVWAVGIGGDPRSYCAIATDPHWVGDVASFPEKYGQLVIPYLVDLFNGKKVPARLFVRNSFLTAANIADHYDVSACQK